MKTRTLITMAMLGVVLTAGCSGWQSLTVQSQRDRNWLKADPSAISTAREMDEPDILPRTYFAAAQLHEAQGQFDQAIIQYRKAIAVNHRYVEAYNRLGILLGRVGRHIDAEAALRQAVELQPDSALLRNNLGFEYALQNRWSDAEAELSNATRLDPEFNRAWVNLGMVLAKQQRYEESLDAFLTALPEADAFYNLGLMFRSAHRYHDAADSFRHVLALNPSFAAAEKQMADMAGPLSMNSPLEPRANLPRWPAVAGTNTLTPEETLVRLSASQRLTPISNQPAATVAPAIRTAPPPPAQQVTEPLPVAQPTIQPKPQPTPIRIESITAAPQQAVRKQPPPVMIEKVNNSPPAVQQQPTPKNPPEVKIEQIPAEAIQEIDTPALLPANRDSSRVTPVVAAAPAMVSAVAVEAEGIGIDPCWEEELGIGDVAWEEESLAMCLVVAPTEPVEDESVAELTAAQTMIEEEPFNPDCDEELNALLDAAAERTGPESPLTQLDWLGRWTAAPELFVNESIVWVDPCRDVLY